MSELQKIDIDLIDTSGRIRIADPVQVEGLKASILEVGLINPITVCLRDGQHFLVAGGNRLEAYRSIGWDEIPAHIVEFTKLEQTIAECDENLCGTKLTAAEKALFTIRRKEAYEALHPESRHGGDRASRQVGDFEIPNDDSDIGRFTADTAARTGQSERVVQRDAERGEKIIPEVLEMVRGTRLNTGAYLDSIKRLPPNDQFAAVKRDLAHEKRSSDPDQPRGGIAARIKQADDGQEQLPSFEAVAGMLDQLWRLSADDFLAICPPPKRAAMQQRMARLREVFDQIVDRRLAE